MKQVQIKISPTDFRAVGKVRAKIQSIGPTIVTDGRKVRLVTIDVKCDSGGRRATFEIQAHLRNFELVMKEEPPDKTGFYDSLVGLRPAGGICWARPGMASKK